MRRASEYEVIKDETMVRIPSTLMPKRAVINHREQSTPSANPLNRMIQMVAPKPKSSNKKQPTARQRRGQWRMKNIDQICQIVSYYLGQYHIPIDILHQQPSRQSPYNNEEMEKLKNRFQNLSIGLFIMKLPNPDNPPQDLIQFYTGDQNKKQEEKSISFYQAINLYNQIFQNQLPENLNWAQKQKTAFMISFFLLNIPQTTYKQLKERDEATANTIEQFIHTMEFYKIVEGLTVQNYQKLRKKHPNLFLYEQNLIPSIKRRIDHLFLLDNFVNSADINTQFSNVKIAIVQDLRSLLNLREIGAELFERESFLRKLLSRMPRIDVLLSLFPDIIFEIVRVLKREEHTERLLYKGGYLKKFVEQEQSIWVKTGDRPKDVITLLRNAITYKLTRRGNMFVRPFLSSCEEYIFLVIDCNEQNMEAHSQNNTQTMQVEMGSIDLFSFQPVDQYNRPLRLNQYIRQKRFYEKYNLGKNKSDKDASDPMKSVESTLINHYKTATELNVDELRVKIILQQEDLDKAYRWISDFLNIEYIQPQEVLENQYNTDVVDRTEWETYYIYSKLLLEYHNRIQAMIQGYRKQKKVVEEINENLGLIYRLAFVKALFKANQTFNEHHKLGCWEKTIRMTSNKLKNIWDYLEIQEPTAYTQYVSKKRLERIWRKYQVNELKTRSKFVHSQRVYITNKIINRMLNIAPARSIKLIESYFPSHDPYILKGIKIEPYLKVLKDERMLGPTLNIGQKSKLNDLLRQFQCEACKTDFTSQSLEQKLEFKWQNWRNYAQLSIPPIKHYSGSKIALFFSFSEFYTDKLKWMFPLCLIVQILLWVQNSEISYDGSSDLTVANDIILFIFSLINMIWVTNLVEGWRREEEKFEHEYGLANVTSESETRNMFKGEFMRSMEDDNMNYEYAPSWKKMLKQVYSTTISILFLALVITTVIIIFILKGYLIELNYGSTTTSVVPAILISLSSEVYNYIYDILARKLTDFQNHKTISQYQSSLIFKTYLIIFFDNFNSLFLYAFFSYLFSGLNFCEYKTENNATISNCALQVSNQMLTSTLIGIGVDFAKAVYPYLKFKWKQYRDKKKNIMKNSFTRNYFEAIDEFYEEQDEMESFMYNQEIDMTSISYTSLIIKITSLTLFAPALPFAYCILYFDGILAIHAQKFKILMLSQRTIPIKAKSIGLWKKILTIVSFIGVIVNLCFVIYTRQLQATSPSQIFFGFTITLFILKLYLTIFYSEPLLSNTILNRRNEDRLNKILMGLKNNTNIYKQAPINTDIRNVKYDQAKLRRDLTELTRANVKTLRKME